MGIFREFPYTNFHDMNLDYILNHVQELIETWAEYNNNWEQWKNDTTTAFNDLKDLVENFIDDLDIQTAVNTKMEEMYQDGTLQNIITQYAIVKGEYYTATEDFTPLQGLGSNALYNWNIEQLYALYDELMAYPNIIREDYEERTRISKNVIGYGSTISGTQDISLPIYAYTFYPDSTKMHTGSPNRHCVFTSGIHGNEKSSAYALYHVMKKWCEEDYNLINGALGDYIIHVIPICNPWGWNDCVNNTVIDIEGNRGRKNVRGVDLNRNFPVGWTSGNDHGDSAGSEVETQAIMTYITQSCEPANCIMMYDFHTSFNDENHEAETFWCQLGSYTCYDTEVPDTVFNNLISIEKVFRNIRIENQYVNICGATTGYGGLLADWFSSVCASYNGCGTFEGGKRQLTESGFVYNSANLISVYIDFIANVLIRMPEHKMMMGIGNKSILPLGTTLASWGNTQPERIQGFLGNNLSGSYIVSISNPDYRYNIMYDDWAGNIGWSQAPRIWRPSTGHRQNCLIKCSTEKRLTIFDVLANAGIYIMELPT